jgi:hypothetical protein
MTDRIAVLARFLAANLGWMRHRAEVDEFARDIADAAGRMRSLVNGPAEQKYLGPCGALLDAEIEIDGEWRNVVGDTPCPGDVYAYRGASAGRCRACGTEVATADREAWLDAQVRDEAFSARWIADAHGLNVKTVRTWSARGQLKTWWRTEAGLIAEWPPPDDGVERERLHYVGDVLDLAAADAARRETNRATQERRRAAKAADSEEAA